MCINRWCSEKPEKASPQLTPLLSFDQAEVDIFFGHHDSKQTQRDYSITPAVFQKLCAIQKKDVWKKSFFPASMKIVAEKRPLPPSTASAHVDWCVSDSGSKNQHGWNKCRCFMMPSKNSGLRGWFSVENALFWCSNLPFWALAVVKTVSNCHNGYIDSTLTVQSAWNSFLSGLGSMFPSNVLLTSKEKSTGK